ncbi:MAG: TlpA disulfide reductase family protein [Verrucomicrobiota bacterium]
MNTRAGLIVVLAALSLAGCMPPSERAPSEGEAPGAGAPGPAAADFSIPSLGAPGLVSLSSYRGQVVLLDFWATWCPPCRHELPALERMHKDLSGRGFTLIGMNVDQGSPSEVAEAASRFNLSYPLGLAGPEVQAAYGGIRAVPTKFLLDRNGNVRKHYVGVVPERELRADIESLLAM